MSDKRKKRKFDAKRERRRLNRLADQVRLRNGVEIPLGAVVADRSQQVSDNSYSAPTFYYSDKEFECVDCGRREVWMAQAQKWYYEIAKGSLYAGAVRCLECRRSRRARHRGRGDPNPIKHVGSLMKRIRIAIEPELLEAGFQLEGRSYSDRSATSWIDYVRPGLMLQCLFDRREARLFAETMDDTANCVTIASVELDRSSAQSALLERIGEFTLALKQYTTNLPRVVTAQSAADS